MKLFTSLFQPKKSKQKSSSYIKEEIFVQQGREQFKALLKKGLRVPVVLL